MNDSVSKKTLAIEPSNEMGDQDAEEGDLDRRPMQFSKWTWQGFLAVVSALLGASAVLLHLVGTAIHLAYFSTWGIDAGQFPKATDWLVIQGYYGIWNALALVFLALANNAYLVIFLAVAVAFVLAGLSLLRGLLEGPKLRYHWFSDLPSWARPFFEFSVAGVLVSASLLPISLLSIIFLTGIPAIVGKSIGDEWALKEAQDFAKGCETSTAACILLLKDGKEVGKGQLIDSSPTHIAFLDSRLKKVRVIERAGLELQSTRLPASR